MLCGRNILRPLRQSLDHVTERSERLIDRNRLLELVPRYPRPRGPLDRCSANEKLLHRLQFEGIILDKFK